MKSIELVSVEDSSGFDYLATSLREKGNKLSVLLLQARETCDGSKLKIIICQICQIYPLKEKKNQFWRVDLGQSLVSFNKFVIRKIVSFGFFEETSFFLTIKFLSFFFFFFFSFFKENIFGLPYY